MVAVLDRATQHMIFPHIRWETFERILDDIGERRFRFSYLRGELEFMTTSYEHDNFGRWIGRLVFLIALEWNVPIATGGSTTLKESLAEVGLEPDECFWIKHETRMRGKKKWVGRKDPPPDLAIEIDVTSSWLDRLEIYEGLKVPEVWRFDGETFRLLVLGTNGKFKERTKSLAFPSLPMDVFVKFVKKLGSADEISLTKEFTEWLRSDVAAKKTNGEKKNGRRQ